MIKKFLHFLRNSAPAAEGFVRCYLVVPVLAHVRAWMRGRQISEERIRPLLESATKVVIAVVQNERARIPFFLQYYRGLGFEHFILIDNRSTDGLWEMLAEQYDVSVVKADGDYGSARYGLDWINSLAKRFCQNKWLLCVDADEHLELPGWASSIDDVINVMTAQSQNSLQALLLDMYSEHPSSQNIVRPGGDPFKTCPLYDVEGYQTFSNRKTGVNWIKGGVRGRVFFPHDLHSSPALNKTPLVKWSRSACFVKSTHELWPYKLNGANGNVSAVLMHFKFTRMSVERMVAEDYRAQHTEEYSRYDASEQVELRSHIFTRDARSESPTKAIALVKDLRKSSSESNG